MSNLRYAIFGGVGGYDWIDGVINTFSGSLEENITHMFSILPDKKGNYKTYEAEGIKEGADPYPGYFPHALEKWANNKNAIFIKVEVSDKDYQRGIRYAHQLVGHFYGYDACVKGGLWKTLQIKLPDTDITVDCSEADTRIARKMNIDILPDLEAGSVVPADGVNALLVVGTRITWDEVVQIISENKKVA